MNIKNIYKWAFFLILLIPLGLTGCGLNEITNSTPDPISILVSITDPATNEKYPLTSAINIRAEALSDDAISRLELWADGQLVESYTPVSHVLSLLAHTFHWTSTSLGDHTLLVRAYNSGDQPAQSNILNLTSIEDPGIILLYTVKPGEDLKSIAQLYNITLFQILQENTTINPARLTVGQLLRIPLGIRPTSRSSSLADAFVRASPLLMGNFRLINYLPAPASSLILASNQSPAPALSVSLKGCDVILTITDAGTSATGYQVYRLNPGGAYFTKIASISAEPDGVTSFKDVGLSSGQYQYYVAAYSSGMFAASAETPSNIVSAKFSSETCPGDDLTITDLLPSASGVSQVYLYLSDDGEAWRRFPPSQFTFLPPDQPFNLAEMAGMLALTSTDAPTLQGEGWGWKDGILTHLGNFSKSLPAGSAPVSQSPANLAQFYQTDLRIRGIGLSGSNNYNWETEYSITEYKEQVFRWGTNTGADAGLWQVSALPFDPSPSLNPTCLLITKSVPAASLQYPLEFKIDFTSLAPAPVKASQASNDQNASAGLVLFTGFPPLSPPYSPEKVMAGDQQGQQVVANNPVLLDPCNLSKSADGSRKFYVRILPMKNNQPLSTPSNQVVVTFTTEKGIEISVQMAPYIKFYDIKILEFTEMNVPDPTYEYCIKITKNPYYKNSNLFEVNPKWIFTAPGDTLCPDKYEEDSSIIGDIISIVKKAVDLVSKLYDELSDFVTDLAEKLNPACIGASFVTDAVGKGSKEVESACHYIAVVAVAAAKTYAGMPPSLPNFDQMVGMGKDYMVELAADELESSGIPCPQECKDLIEDGIDYTFEQVKSAVSSPACMGEDEAHSHGIEPLCPPDGVQFVLAPQGQPAPPTAIIRVTRTANSAAANIPQPASCYAGLTGTAQNNSYVFKTLNLYWLTQTFKWQGTALNEPLAGAGSPIPTLAPSQSIDIPLILDPYPFWFPGHYQWYQQWMEVPTYDDWAYLYQGANLTLTASGSCSFPGTISGSFQHVVGETKSYGPLGEAYLQTCYPNCP